MSEFHVGQQVRCIDDAFRAKDAFWCKGLPAAGEVYTVRELVPGHRGMGVRLAELVNPRIPVRFPAGIVKMEPTFLSSRFRTCTDISTLIEMQEMADA